MTTELSRAAPGWQDILRLFTGGAPLEPEPAGPATRLGTALDVMGVGMMTAPAAGIYQTLPKVAPAARKAAAATAQGLRRSGVLSRATRGGRAMRAALYETGPTKGITPELGERATAKVIGKQTTIPERTLRGLKLTPRGQALAQGHETGHVFAENLIRKAGKGDQEAGAFSDALMEAASMGHYRPPMSLARSAAETEAAVPGLAHLQEAIPHDPTEKVADMLMLLAHAPQELNSVQWMILSPFITP